MATPFAPLSRFASRLLAWHFRPVTKRRRLRRANVLEDLEDRILLSIAIEFDYSLDTNGFFADQARRDLLEYAGHLISDRLGDSLQAINPSGSNTWSPTISHPGTGANVSLGNGISVPANTLLVYAGGRNLGAGEAGRGGSGGFSASGTQAWLNTIEGRGQSGALQNPATDFSPWGGSITFDTVGTTWFFGETTEGLDGSESDFLSVALHELGHVFGFSGGVESWSRYISGGNFTGPRASAQNGGPVPLADSSHWANSTSSQGLENAMDPQIVQGTRKLLTSLDFAGLLDIGWTSNQQNETLYQAAHAATWKNGDNDFSIGFPNDPIESSKDVDFYRVYAEAGSTIQAILQPNAGFDTFVRIYDSSGATLDAGGQGAAGQDDTASFDVIRDDFYYVAVSSNANRTYNPKIAGSGPGGPTGGYFLTLNLGETQPDNVAPSIAGFSGSVDYSGSAIVLDANASVSDPDSGNFAGGQLVVELTANADADDRLIIRNEGTTSGKIGVSGNQVTFSGLVIGTFSGGIGSSPLTINLRSTATHAATTALLRSLQYDSVSSNPPTNPRTVEVTLLDGDGGTSTPVSKTINILVSDPPVISNFSGSVDYAGFSGSAIILDADASVSDVDSANFAGGQLVIELTANADADDRLIIRNEGTTSGKIGVSGNQVTFSGLVIGTFSGGIGSSPLTINLRSTATHAATTALLRNLQYDSVSSNPPTNPRTVEVTLLDGDGGTSTPVSKTINILVSDPPVISNFSGSVDYAGFSGSAIVLDANASVSDPDSGNFAGGQLVVELTANADADDRLIIRNEGTTSGKIGVSGNQVTFSGLVIGTFSGGIGSSPLTIDLKSTATHTATTALLQNIQYHSVSPNPPTNPRTVEVTLLDGDGGTSTPVSKTINILVSDPPVISKFSGSVSYAGSPVILDSDVSVNDPDSGNFAGGQLVVELTANANADDRLIIRNEGTTSGKIGVSGNQVTFSGLVIGTFSGGIGSSPLTIDLRSTATHAATTALLRNLQYDSVSSNPPTNPRTVEVTLLDGDGGTSTPVSKTINILVSDPPVISNFSGSVNYAGSPVILDSDVGVNDPDSANFAGGQLVIELTANANVDDRLGIRDEGTTSGRIGVSGNQVTFSGLVIGTFSGGTGSLPLTIDLRSTATHAATTALLQNIQFQSVASTPPTNPRTVEITLQDGDGGTSTPVSKTINILVSDPPVISNFSGSVNYAGSPVILDSDVSVNDPDSGNFAGGQLVVELTANADADDRLLIRNEGTTSGKIGVSGNQVTFSGLVIGTFSGGTGSLPLTINLRSTATHAAMTALLQNIQYDSVSLTPPSNPRTVEVTLQDGDGGTSTPVTKQIQFPV